MHGERGRRARALRTAIERIDVLIVAARSRDQQVLGEHLGAPRHRTVFSRTAKDGLKRLAERPCSVIVVDAQHSELRELQLGLRRRRSLVPTICLVGREVVLGELYRGAAAFPIDHVVKPVDPTVLRAKVRLNAGLRRSELQLEQQAAIIRDATRKVQHARAAESGAVAEKRYENLTQAITEAVMTLDPEGALEYCNRRWLEYTGLSFERSRGRGFVAALHPEDKRRFVRAWERAVASGEAFEIECRLMRGFDGAMRWHTCRALPERDASGTIVGWLCTYSDSEDLKQAIRARDEFLSIASHELRTPLTALKLRLESLSQSAPPEEHVRRKLDGAVRQTQRLERLIDHLLDASRIREGHLVLDRSPVSLGELTGEVLERAREGSAATNQVFEFVTEGDLVGTWDGMRLEQVVENLVSNALKYGAGKPIEVAVCEGDDAVDLRVEDHGIGIHPADLSRIFEQFERGASGRGRSGLGLGLYITRQIVTAHGGRIEVASRLGEGSVFRVVLPRRAPPLTPPH